MKTVLFCSILSIFCVFCVNSQGIADNPSNVNIQPVENGELNFEETRIDKVPIYYSHEVKTSYSGRSSHHGIVHGKLRGVCGRVKGLFGRGIRVRSRGCGG